jgi:hypothetical protein
MNLRKTASLLVKSDSASNKVKPTHEATDYEV